MSRQSNLKLASGNVLLMCEGHDHEHLCGVDQVERLLRDVCPWCREVQRWQPVQWEPVARESAK